MRGEYQSSPKAQKNPWELPPHARRIHRVFGKVCSFLGTTSACAENTSYTRTERLRAWNYLRMRGEYLIAASSAKESSELPPHARRIHLPSAILSTKCGTTSACAENTQRQYCTRCQYWNYLRMRGEYRDINRLLLIVRELPPHARRILSPGVRKAIYMGTTSACAENTPQPTPARENPWNYLRMRGEYPVIR